jgi:hypothetical protein
LGWGEEIGHVGAETKIFNYSWRAGHHKFTSDKKKKKQTRERKWFGDGEENEKKAFLFCICVATIQSKVHLFFINAEMVSLFTNILFLKK